MLFIYLWEHLIKRSLSLNVKTVDMLLKTKISTKISFEKRFSSICLWIQWNSAACKCVKCPNKSWAHSGFLLCFCVCHNQINHPIKANWCFIKPYLNMTFHKLSRSSLISDFMEKHRKLTGSMNRRVNKKETHEQSKRTILCSSRP